MRSILSHYPRAALRLAALALLGTTVPGPVLAQQVVPGTAPSPKDIRAVAPALGHYTEDVLVAEVWKRPDLSPRDRGLVTVAALVTEGQTGGLLAHYMDRALDGGVTPAELSETLTHLAFYAGWPNALSAAAVAKDVFDRRGVKADWLPGIEVTPLPFDEAADKPRASGVERVYGPVVPALVGYTNGVLFGDVWRRPGLAPRDRSLVTIAALVAGGHAEQLPFHLNRGLDNGLTRVQLGEALTHLAFYAGWPKALSAVPVAKAVFDKRPN
jgi:4-carboxymuconolactone decarboxylase